MPLKNHPSAASDVASAALTAASRALSVCADAIGVLDARVAFLEHVLESTQRPAPATSPKLLELARESRSHVDTATAARLLHISPTTLRRWAAQNKGPITPLRERGRWTWPVAAIRTLAARG